MGTLISAFFIAIVAGLGFVLPQKYNERFKDDYGQSAINMGLSFGGSIGVIYFLLMLDYMDSFWFILSIIVLVAILISIIYMVYKPVKSVTKSDAKAFGAVFMQMLSMAGFVITILSIIVLLFGNDRKKKR